MFVSSHFLQAGSKGGVEAIHVLPKSAGAVRQAGGGDTRDGSSDWPAGLVRMIRSAAGASSTSASSKTLALVLISITTYWGVIPEAQLLPSLVCLRAEKHLAAVFHSYGAKHGV